MTRLDRCFGSRAALAIIMLVSTESLALGQNDAAFTYQGELKDSGTLANGAYDFHFSLYAGATGGLPVAADVELLGVHVQDGRFTVTLDFGTDAFALGEERWLRILVRSSTSFWTAVDPRQQVSPTPYSAATRGIFVNDDGDFLGIGRDYSIGSERFGVHSTTTSGYAGMYMSTLGQNASPFYGYSTGGETNAWHYYDGSTKDWHLFNEGVALTVTNQQSVGIGTMSPDLLSQLDVRSDRPRAARFENSAGGLAIYARSEDSTGIQAESYAPQGLGLIAHHEGSGAGTGVTGKTSSPTGTGVVGWATSNSGSPVGVRGRASTSTGFDFYADGVGVNYGAASSRRWKHNITPIEDALDKVLALRGVTFDWDAEHGGQPDLGMIAEETGEILPEIVSYEENGADAVGMDYSKLGPVLIEALKELRAEKNAEIAVLQATCLALAERLERLEGQAQTQVASAP